MIKRDEARNDEIAGVYREIGTRIRGIREKQSMTQDRLANLVHLTRTSVTNIEKGRQKFLVHTLLDLAAALAVPAAELLPEPSPPARGELTGLLRGLPSEEQEWIRAAIDSSPEE